MTSQWARWRLKSPALRLFSQPYIQAQIKGNIKALRHWPLYGEFNGEFPIQRASNSGQCFHLMTSSWCTQLSVHVTDCTVVMEIRQPCGLNQGILHNTIYVNTIMWYQPSIYLHISYAWVVHLLIRIHFKIIRTYSYLEFRFSYIRLLTIVGVNNKIATILAKIFNKKLIQKLVLVNSE